MVLRGVIASYTPDGRGSVIVNGDPYPFTLERMWQSSVLPCAGMQVDVTFSQEVGIASIVVVESQPAAPSFPTSFQAPPPPQCAPPAQEYAQPTPQFGQPAPQFTQSPQQFGQPAPHLGRSVAAPFAPPAPGASNSQPFDFQALATITSRPLDIADVAAVLVLVIGWFVLPTVSINLGFLGELKITFWQIIGHVDGITQLASMGSGSPLGTFLQLLAVLSLIAALLPLVLRVPFVRLAAAAPLAVMALAVLAATFEIQRAARMARGLMGGDFSSALGNQFAEEMAKMVHVGPGAFLALLAALWLVVSAVLKFTSK
jgi:hypothetical protein